MEKQTNPQTKFNTRMFQTHSGSESRLRLLELLSNSSGRARAEWPSISDLFQQTDFLFCGTRDEYTREKFRTWAKASICDFSLNAQLYRRAPTKFKRLMRLPVGFPVPRAAPSDSPSSIPGTAVLFGPGPGTSSCHSTWYTKTWLVPECPVTRPWMITSGTLSRIIPQQAIIS